MLHRRFRFPAVSKRPESSENQSAHKVPAIKSGYP